MKEIVDQHIADIEAFVANSPEQLEEFRIKYIGKKGLMPALFAKMKDLDPEKRKEAGQLLNTLKNAVNNRIEVLKAEMKSAAGDNVQTEDDLSRPANFSFDGSRHPLSIVRKKMIDIFARMGFTVEEGPEIEDDWHNFSALNFPPEHPARDMQDTFFIDKDPDIALRTHTSSVQIRK